MKTKMTAIFATLMIALIFVGFAYAHWSQMLTISGTINTGEFCIGIRNVGTDDDPGDNDGVPNAAVGDLDPGYDTILQKCTIYDKNVASATSTNIGDVKCTKKDINYYEEVKFTIDDAYPSYCPMFVLEVVNCGTIPGEIDSMTIHIVEKDEDGIVIADGIYDVIKGDWVWTTAPPATGTALDDIKPVKYKIDIDCDGDFDYKGTNIDDMVDDLKKEYGDRIQLDECDGFAIWLCVHFEQGLPADLLPMNHTIDITIITTYMQWNFVD
jgi:hypothetical protein